MACDLKTKHDVAYGIKEQTTWGTAEVGSSTFVRLDCEPVDMDADAKIHELNLVTGTRDLDKTQLIHHTKGSSPFLSVVGHIKKDDLPLFLYGVIQNVAEDAVVGQFNKVFTFPEDGQPDFSAAEGKIFTVAKQMPTVADSNSFRDAICKQLNLVWEPEGESGVGKMTALLVGRGAMDYGYDMTSATLTPYDNDLFYFHDLNTCTVDLGGAQGLIPTRIEIEIGNNMMPVSVDTTTPGQFGCMILVEYYCTAKITCAWDATVDDIRQEAALTAAATDRQWIVEWGTAATDGHLKFDMNAQPGPAPHVDEDLNVVEFTLRCLRNGLTKPLTVTATDAIDRGW
jgi:hypothetical protein